ncbi:MAG: tetratricopeptide repeat protein [Burkholderiales bacterium]|nr:tetratricopeptide repeat protein [Burkholderiales bacterium]
MLAGFLGRLTGDRREKRAAARLAAAVRAREAGRLDDAERAAAAALAALPGSADAHLLLSDIALRRGDLAAAESRAKTVLRAQPENAEALYLVIAVRRRQGRLADAERLLLRLLDSAPEHLDARVDLAGILIERGQHADAAALLNYVLKRAPALAPAHANMGVAKHMLGDDAAAAEHFREALRLAPADEAARNNHALFLRDRGELAAAAAELRAALERDPASERTRINLANVLRESAQPGEALAVLEAVPVDGALAAERAATLAKVLQDRGDLAAATEAHDRAVALRPEAADVRLTRALHLLALGRFEEGWTEYEQRLRGSESPRRAFPVPDWDGGPLAGKRVLVYAEQGLGDEIMFASCLPDLAREAGRVVVECDARLARLFAHSFPQLAVFAGRGKTKHPWLAEAGELDCAVPAGSLPGLYRRTRAAFPGTPYLAVPPERVAAWRERLSGIGPGPWVGVAWRGGVGKTREAARSMAPARMLEALAGGGRRFVSLQHGVRAGEIESCGGALHAFPDALTDAMEQASLMAALDAIVTVCNTTVHLGGALGLPVLVLVPSSPEWRYQYEGEHMPWYASVRLLRQTVPGDWDGPLAKARAALEARC